MLEKGQAWIEPVKEEQLSAVLRRRRLRLTEDNRNELWFLVRRDDILEAIFFFGWRVIVDGLLSFLWVINLTTNNHTLRHSAPILSYSVFGEKKSSPSLSISSFLSLCVYVCVVRRG